MKLWLILLGIVTVLVIALRRTRKRQAPLDDELYAQRVAVDHVHSGVSWVRVGGTFGSVNPSFAKTFRRNVEEFENRDWYLIFHPDDRARARDLYAQMMLMGVIDFESRGERADGSFASLKVRLVAVHDGHMRFVGHHCLIEDKTREHELEQRVSEFENRARAGGQAVINALRQAKRTTETEPSSATLTR